MNFSMFLADAIEILIRIQRIMVFNRPTFNGIKSGGANAPHPPEPTADHYTAGTDPNAPSLCEIRRRMPKVSVAVLPDAME